MYPEDFWHALELLVAGSTIVIDRPRGSKHPVHDLVYPYDYGYLDGTVSSDGEDIDIWVGDGGALNAVLCTVDLDKRDSEIKLLLGFTPRQQQEILAFHNRQSQKAVLVPRSNS